MGEHGMNARTIARTLCFAAAVAASLAVAHAAPRTEPAPATRFHLAPRVAKVPPISNAAMLSRLDALCRVAVQWQDKDGAIIDPFLHREFQYATPYFAFAVGTLAEAGRSPDLLPHGVAAMERATQQLAGGRPTVPDQHGEFFLASLTEALPVYRRLVPREQWMRWHDRLQVPIDEVIGEHNSNNWRTYAMKGEWRRATLGLVPHAEAVAFVESYWKSEQRDRFASPPAPLYHDRSSDPDTLSVALVGEGNLLSLVVDGYDGPSAAEIRQKVLDALRATLFMVDPTGQVPANGRTDDHVWTEVGLQLAFSAAAPMLRADGDARTADAMERAAQLSFQGMQRWRMQDRGYFITKNHFDPKLRVGYQNASQCSNYTGALMFHLAEMYRLRSRAHAPASPAPTVGEIGGYAFELDQQFATAFANAGGLQMQFNLRGETKETNDNWWTPLGVVRVARAAWDTRLGPSDGAQTAKAAVSFAPEFFRDGRWTRFAELPAKYEARWSVQLVNPAIVRCTLEYRPVAEGHGPSFRDRFILTPDGVLSSVERISVDNASWATTWPLLINDGTPLRTLISPRIAEASYPVSRDTESFLALDAGATLDSQQAPVRSTYGDLLPIRMQTASPVSHTFVYPHDHNQPDARAVLDSFRLTPQGFQSILGRVEGDVYIGQDFAGGHAVSVDLNGDGRLDLQFDHACGFVLHLRRGAVTSIEVDQPVTARLQGRTYRLAAYLARNIPYQR